MRAITVTRREDGNETRIGHLPDPSPAAGQIRIRMVGAAVNAADLRIIDDPGQGPLGLGLDVAGIVDLAAPDVGDLVVGTPVAALTFPFAAHAVAGTAAEYVIVPAADAAPVPEGIDLLDAATVPLNSLTADQLLAHLGPPRGRSLLVTGAAGGLGGYAVALAALAGWKVTGLARASDAAFLTRAGAAETITSLADAADFDAVLDAALLGAAAMRTVRHHGHYEGVVPGLEPQPERGITVMSGVVAPDGRRLRDLLALTANGTLEARRAGTTSLENAAPAFQSLRDGGQRGRWVLTP
ncbi:NADPH:quinone reductase [Asanoa ishikariensis]|uniref:NADPH:quinone reductase n=1 Tax=Asanoa ishikariensis TaxID=137265 RepID=A0A1H3TKP6_9ACTN|nr:zinc-binding dehydrogenase [Asanoa ishikariensis]GIF62309.1 NADPH:quinone reductase [Asanoa ishikariensis]SDZ50381.1 NADPH:quinone reductase [Asanoa ishikariensis]